MPAIDPAWIALIGTLFGGIGLKVAEKWLNRNSDNRSDRKDYRETVNELHERIDRMQDDIDELRRNLYASQEEAALLRVYIIEKGLPLPGKDYKE